MPAGIDLILGLHIVGAMPPTSHKKIMRRYMNYSQIPNLRSWDLNLVQITIYRRPLVGQDGHLDQSEAYDIS